MVQKLVGKHPIDCDLSKGMKGLADSQSVINLASNQCTNRRNKHIDITFHYVRDAANNGEADVGYVATSEMDADLLTKPLGRVTFERLRTLCGITIKKEM